MLIGIFFLKRTHLASAKVGFSLAEFLLRPQADIKSARPIFYLNFFYRQIKEKMPSKANLKLRNLIEASSCLRSIDHSLLIFFACNRGLSGAGARENFRFLEL